MTKIHIKLQKILALIEGATTEGEMMTAHAVLQKAAIKYGIEQSELDALKDGIGRAASVDLIEENVGKIVSQRPDAEWSVASVVADNYRCGTYFKTLSNRRRGTYSWQIAFTGEPDDVGLAIQAFESTIGVIEKWFKPYAKERKEDIYSDVEVDVRRFLGEVTRENAKMWKELTKLGRKKWRKERKTLKYSYYTGFASALREHYEKLKETYTSTELARLDIPVAVTDALAEIETTKERKEREVDYCAINKGYSDGCEFSAGRSLEGL